MLLNSLEDCSEICRIYKNPPEDAVVTRCGHIFCNQYILEYLIGNDSICPSAPCKVHLNIRYVFARDTLRSSLSDQPKYDDTTFKSIETYKCSQGL